MGGSGLLRPAVAQGRTVRVGWFVQPGYQDTNPQGEPEGLHYEYLMQLAQYTDWDYEFVMADSFSACYEMLKEGEVDLMGYLLKTPEREAEVVFPEINSGYVTTSLYVRADSPIAPYDFTAFRGMRVGCVSSTKNPDYLREYSLQNGFSVRTVAYPNNEAVEQAVVDGKVDAGLNAGHQEMPNTRIVASFAPKPYYFATRQNSAQLAQELNTALGMMQIERPYLDKDLARKYLPQTKSGPLLTQEEKQFVQECGPVTVCYQSQWFPISAHDKVTGRFSGISADMFKRISELTGLSFTYHKETQETGHACDAQLISAAVYSAPSTLEGYTLTGSYLNVPLVVVRKMDTPVSNTPRTAIIGQVVPDAPQLLGESAPLVACASMEDCFDAVLSGEAEQALVNAYAADYLFKRSEYRMLTSSVLYNETYDLCIGVENGQDPRLRSILNKAVGFITEADMSAIINKNITQALKMDLNAVFDYMPADIVLVSIVVLGIVVVLAVLLMLRQTKHAREIKRLLYTDDVTGALSFRGFLARASSKLGRPGPKCAFVIDLDINHFGDFNTLNGYQNGNDLLKTITHLLGDLCLTEGVFARVQADRFVCLLFDDSTQAVSARLKLWLQQFRDITGLHSVLISFGICRVTDPTESVVTLCDHALLAKRTVKGNYDQFVGVYDQRLHYRQLQNTHFLESFDEAVHNGSFVHYYQPQYSTHMHQLTGAEALVRWRGIDNEIIMPGKFITLLEQNGLICALDMHMFERLCQKIAQWRSEGIEPVPVSINFSRAHLFDNDFTAKLQQYLVHYNVPAAFIKIEITETGFAEQAASMMQTLNALHKIGFQVAIDDFGSGYSALNLLQDLRFDILKLDRGFLNTVSQTRRGEKIIRNIVSLAHDLQLETVAEGVETKAQLELLQQCNCDVLQGFYFSKPLPEEQFELLLKANYTPPVL